MSTDNIFLRLPRIEDAEFILNWENNPENWQYSSTETPYEYEDIVQLIQTFKNLNELDQVRYMIVQSEPYKILGAVDVFSIDRTTRQGEIGVLIADPSDRRKGIARKALSLLESIVIEEFNLSKLTALVELENEASLNLFLSLNYVKNGTRKLHLFPNAPYIQTQVLEKWLKK